MIWIDNSSIQTLSAPTYFYEQCLPFLAHLKITFFYIADRTAFLVTKPQLHCSFFFHDVFSQHVSHFVWKAIVSFLTLKTMDNNSVHTQLHALCSNSPVTFQNSALSPVVLKKKHFLEMQLSALSFVVVRHLLPFLKPVHCCYLSGK